MKTITLTLPTADQIAAVRRAHDKKSFDKGMTRPEAINKIKWHALSQAYRDFKAKHLAVGVCFEIAGVPVEISDLTEYVHKVSVFAADPFGRGLREIELNMAFVIAKFGYTIEWVDE